MKSFITLRTDAGNRVFVSLDGWGAGMDRKHRRWTREPEGWRCIDNGEFARKSGLLFSRNVRPLGIGRR